MSLGESFAGPAGLAGAAEPAGGAALAGTILRAATARPAATAATTARIVSLRSSVFGIAGRAKNTMIGNRAGFAIAVCDTLSRLTMIHAVWPHIVGGSHPIGHIEEVGDRGDVPDVAV